MPEFRRLIAIDPSLSCSGWAMFRISDGRVISLGKIRGYPAVEALSLRLKKLQEQVAAIFSRIELGQLDILTCESPTTMRDPHAAIKVEQVRSIFETQARSRGANVPGRVNPRSVQFEVMGLSGKQLTRTLVKESAVRTVQAIFESDLKRLGFPVSEVDLKKHQDIVDALLVGRAALARVNSAKVAGIALEELFDESRRRRRRIRLAA